MVKDRSSAESTHWTAFRRPRRTMRRFRMFGAGVTIAAVVGAMASTGVTANAATVASKGTSRASDSVLKINLGANGSVLSVRLLGDDGLASIDPAVKNPSAASSAITALALTSTAVPALNNTVGALNAQSTGAEQKNAAGPISLKTPPTDVGPLKAGTIADGTVNPATLTAAVTDTGATSGLTTALSGVSVAGGLLSLPAVPNQNPSNPTSDLGANALTTGADGTRG